MQVKALLIALFIVSFIVNSFVQLPFLPAVMTFLAAGIVCLGVRELTPLTREMIMLLLLGSGLFIWSGSGNFDWNRAATANAGIVTLLLTAPMLGFILHYAPYDGVILSLANRYVRTSYLFYVTSAALTVCLGALMNLAAIPFVHQLLSPVATRYSPLVLQRALTRGFCINLFWAPNMVSIAVILQYVRISWQELALPGIAFALLAFGVVCLIGAFEHGRGMSDPVPVMENTPAMIPQPVCRRCLYSLIAQIGVILFVLTFFIRCSGQSIYVLIALVNFAIPLLFALLLGKTTIYRLRLAEYLQEKLPAMSNEFILFISIGFFGHALSRSPAIAAIQTQLAAIGDYTSAAAIFGIIAVIAGLALTGIHPMVTISSLALVLGEMNTGLSAVQLAITLAAGYIAYLLVSPFSSMVMILSGLSGKNVYAVGLRLNWRYAVALALVVTVVIRVWRSDW